MVRKITDAIFAESAKELYDNEDKIQKVAFNMAEAAGTLLGYTAGNAAGRAIGKQQGLTQSIKNQEIPSIEGDYYSQVNNIMKNLKIMFTPMSVVYMLRDKGKPITLDVIETGEMDAKMKTAFDTQNEDFFKKLMLNKIKLEVQRVEQMYASRILNANNKIDEILLQKKASEEEPRTMYDDFRMFLTIQDTAMSKEDDTYAGFLTKVAFIDNEVEIPVALSRPIRDYSELGLEDIETYKYAATKKTQDMVLQDRLLNPSHIKKNLRIGFIADRVTFTVDGIIIAQLPALGMNEEGYEAFQRRDVDYFKKVFMGNATGMTKKASEVLTINDVFYVSTVHPKIYYILFNNKLGNDWFKYQPEVLIKSIEDEFGLTKAIAPRVVDKILVIQNICNSIDCLNNAFIFEKTMRALNSKSIDFSRWEYNLTPGELIAGLQIVDELTPTNDIFDDLSEDVMGYLASSFVLGECRAIVPDRKIISSELEEKFFQTLNSDINKKWSSLNSDEMMYQKTIQPLSIATTVAVRRMKKYDSEAIDKALNALTRANRINNERVINLSRKTAIINLSIDMMIEQLDANLAKTREDLNI